MGIEMVFSWNRKLQPTTDEIHVGFTDGCDATLTEDTDGLTEIQEQCISSDYQFPEGKNFLLYRAHWATRNRDLDGQTETGDLNPGVVQERHHAANWLTCYDDGAEWDEVTTDT